MNFDITLSSHCISDCHFENSASRLLGNIIFEQIYWVRPVTCQPSICTSSLGDHPQHGGTMYGCDIRGRGDPWRTVPVPSVLLYTHYNYTPHELRPKTNLLPAEVFSRPPQFHSPGSCPSAPCGREQSMSVVNKSASRHSPGSCLSLRVFRMRAERLNEWVCLPWQLYSDCTGA